MFALGFICGLIVLAFLLWLLMSSATVSTTTPSDRAKQEIRDLERQTIHRLLAAELASQTFAPRPRSPGEAGSGPSDIAPRP